MDQIEQKRLRKFAWTMVIAFTILGVLIFRKHAPVSMVFFSISFAFILIRYGFERALDPIERIWMKFAHVLGWINTRIILTAVFFIIVTPIRFVLWICKKDLLSETLSPSAQSYWIERKTPLEAENRTKKYERLF